MSAMIKDAANFFVSTWNEAIHAPLEEWFSLRGAVLPSIGTIIVTEIGDKTFFIAALMTMKYSSKRVFAGAICALALMTVLSAIGGNTLPMLVDKRITKWISIILFLYFGVTQLYQAYYMDEEEPNEELASAEEQLGIRLMESPSGKRSARTIEAGDDDDPHAPQIEEDQTPTDSTTTTAPGVMDVGTGSPTNATGATVGGTAVIAKSMVHAKCEAISYRVSHLMSYVDAVVWQAFTWTFVAEWGDRSQIATVVLATNHNWILVSIGAIFGHCLCTGLACWAGRFISESVTEKTLTYASGIFFLIFGVADMIFNDF